MKNFQTYNGIDRRIKISHIKIKVPNKLNVEINEQEVKNLDNVRNGKLFSTSIKFFV